MDIVRIGTLLYGNQWQTQLAERLGVTARTVRRWGGVGPAWVAGPLRVAAEERVVELREWLDGQ